VAECVKLVIAVRVNNEEGGGVALHCGVVRQCGFTTSLKFIKQVDANQMAKTVSPTPCMSLCNEKGWKLTRFSHSMYFFGFFFLFTPKTD